MSDDLPQPAVTSIPIATGADGQPYIGCDAAVAMLRSIAAVTETLGLDDEPSDLAAAIRIEADALECRAIAHTSRTVS